MAQTGNSTTISFGTSSFAPTVNRIDIGEMTREALDDSHLGTTNQMTKIASDLADAGSFDMEIQWNQSAGVFPPINGAAETVTISFPLKSGESTRATLAGTAFVTAVSGPNVANGEIMVATITVTWDGKTERAFTPGS